MTREREQACQSACACVGWCVARGTVLRGEGRARSGLQARPERGGVRGLGGGYRGRGFLRAPQREGRVRKGGVAAARFLFFSSPQLSPSDPSRSIL